VVGTTEASTVSGVGSATELDASRKASGKNSTGNVMGIPYSVGN
jgi:hypothetical protein